MASVSDPAMDCLFIPVEDESNAHSRDTDCKYIFRYSGF